MSDYFHARKLEGLGQSPRRGADRRELLVPLLDNGVAFIIRQRGDRPLLVEHGARLPVDAIAGEMLQLASLGGELQTACWKYHPIR